MFITGRLLPVFLGFGMALLCGCTQEQAHPPFSVAEYDQMQRANPNAYPQQVIVQWNQQRAMDGDLPAASRVESLRLVLQLAGDDAAVRARLADMLRNPVTPPLVMQTVLTFLLQKDYPDLATTVVQALPNLKESPALQDAIMDWLARHPTPEVLSELVRLWAAEPPSAGAGDERYQQVIQKVSGKPWDAALIDAINNAAFTAPGSAVAVLQRRLGVEEGSKKLSDAKIISPNMLAAQVFLEKFNYLPANENEFPAAAQMYQMQRAGLEDASKLAAVWKTDGYVFNIRDYHLLNHVARDPLRRQPRRAEFIDDIGKSIAMRKHVRYKPPTGMNIDDDFAHRADQLSMADLWNIHLLTEMFDRPITQAAVDRMATKDRAETHTALGGLIFYQQGQAEAVRYPPSMQGRDDQVYTPATSGPRGAGRYDFLADQRDSLCRFICHCEKLDNAARVGPTADEIRDAKAGNYYGVVITTIAPDAFAAHYFNPAGEVISLGTYPLRK